MKILYKLLAVLFVGFAGGAISPWVLGWIKATGIPNPSDAVAIANTYIVFTTLIFVAFTVVLGIASYVFTQQFSASKEASEDRLIGDLRERMKSDAQLSQQTLNALLENPEVRSYLEERLAGKVDELLAERLADSQASAEQSRKDADAIGQLRQQLNPNGDRRNQ